MLITEVGQLKHGMKVKCEIGGTHIEDARIQITDGGTIYICQNLMGRSFSDIPFGYECIWTIADEGRWESNFRSTVTNLCTAEKVLLSEMEVGDVLVGKYGNKVQIIAVLEKACLLSALNDFNQADAWWTFQELEEDGWKFDADFTKVIKEDPQKETDFQKVIKEVRQVREAQEDEAREKRLRYTVEKWPGAEPEPMTLAQIEQLLGMKIKIIS